VVYHKYVLDNVLRDLVMITGLHILSFKSINKTSDSQQLGPGLKASRVLPPHVQGLERRCDGVLKGVTDPGVVPHLKYVSRH
jgi:hypothetical protein